MYFCTYDNFMSKNTRRGETIVFRCHIGLATVCVGAVGFH